MPFTDLLQNTLNRVLPEKRTSLPLQPSSTGGIGGGGHVPFEDDFNTNIARYVMPIFLSTLSSMSMAAGYLVFLLFIPALWLIWIWMIVSKPAIIFHASQAFFNFLAMCCFASVAAFQAKWHVGPSGLTGFAVFISVIGICFSFFMLFVPVVYEKYDKGARLARALKEIRVGFILAGAGTVISLLIAFITTISAWTEPGCKNADNDPHAKQNGKDFTNALPGWCSTKKAGAVFFWFAFVFWGATLGLTIFDWRNGKGLRPRDPPFSHPMEEPEEMDEEESIYEHPGARSSDKYDDSNLGQSPFSDNNRYAGVPSVGPSITSNSAAPVLPRPSIDAYGAFSDPAPSGFNSIPPPQSFASPASPPPDGPRVSRTMQYADPYAAIQATVARGQGVSPPASPPSYSTSYGNYR